MGIYKYAFVNDDKFYYNRNKLAGNPRLIKFDPITFLMSGLTVPNPCYSSVEELIRKDKNFREFKKLRQPSTLALIKKEENIKEVKGLIVTSDHDNSQAGRMLMHIIEGNRKAKEFTGVHYLENPLPFYIRNHKIIEPPDENGVYVASFEIENDDGKVLTKQDHSSMFPSEWSKQKVYDECLYALDRKEKVDGKPSTFRSKTRSGIPVEIIFDADELKIKTLYPLRQKQ